MLRVIIWLFFLSARISSGFVVPSGAQTARGTSPRSRLTVAISTEDQYGVNRVPVKSKWVCPEESDVCDVTGVTLSRYVSSQYGPGGCRHDDANLANLCIR